MSPTIILIMLVAIVAFFISLAITYTLTRKNAVRQLCKISNFTKGIVPDYDSYQYVLSGHIPVIDKENIKENIEPDDNHYIVGFKDSQLVVCRCEMRKGMFIVDSPVTYNKENLSKIEVRYMRTNCRLYDKDKKMVCELTVPELTTKEIYEEFPASIDQNDVALKFYDFIEKLSEEISEE